MSDINQYNADTKCKELPGSIVRVDIPAGFEVNLLNLLELTSPSGICLIIRLPILKGGLNLTTLVESLKAAGATIEFEKLDD